MGEQWPLVVDRVKLDAVTKPLVAELSDFLTADLGVPRDHLAVDVSLYGRSFYVTAAFRQGKTPSVDTDYERCRMATRYWVELHRARLEQLAADLTSPGET